MAKTVMKSSCVLGLVEARALSLLRESRVEMCALQRFSSLWEWVEEAVDSRTRPRPGPPAIY